MTSSIFWPSTPPFSLIQSRAISAPNVEDLPSAAAGPDCGAWKPILILADAPPAISSAAAANPPTNSFLISGPQTLPGHLEQRIPCHLSKDQAVLSPVGFLPTP